MKSLRLLAPISFLLISGLVIIYLMTSGTEKHSESEKEPEASQNALENYHIKPVQMPKKLEFAGEQVPLYDNEVRERLDRELLVNTYWQSHTLLLLKRANRWLPLIDSILRAHDVPADFKYVPVIESNLQNLTSPAGAVGFWQFMERTGKERGLEINDQVDERYDVAKSTVAACKYLKDAHEDFGNWTLVASSFNLGVYGVKRVLRSQDANSYYDIELNPETSRYLFRILAIKEIFESPQRYGFHFKEEDLYHQIPSQTVEVNNSVQNWVDFANEHNVTYKTLKNLNPWIRSQKLDNSSGKSYKVTLPKEAFEDQDQGQRLYNKDTLAHMPDSNFLAIHGKTVEETFKKHQVKEGEDIHEIAKHYQVYVPEILEWNNMSTKHVKRGQTLKILEQRIE